MVDTSQQNLQDGLVRDGEVSLPTLLLHFGGQLQGARVAWRLERTAAASATAPVVLVLGGISAGRHVAGNDTDGVQGWWKDVIGPGKPLDTNRYQVLGMDFLGGSGGTTGPSVCETGFPSISAYDQVTVIRHLLAHLQVSKLAALIGASYGGMVALALGEREPHLAERLIVISAAHRTHPMATAWRSVQRAIVKYAITKNEGGEGLRLARALAMATYRSPTEFAQRFMGDAEHDANGFVFPVERYLFSRGDAYKSSYVPESFVCLSESIDLHSVNAAAIHVPTTLVAIKEDQLVPVSDMQELHAQLGGTRQLIELSSLYGHDAFLKEVDALRRAFVSAGLN